MWYRLVHAQEELRKARCCERNLQVKATVGGIRWFARNEKRIVYSCFP